MHMLVGEKVCQKRHLRLQRQQRRHRRQRRSTARLAVAEKLLPLRIMMCMCS